MKNPPAILERSKHGEISCNMVHNAHKQTDYLASRVAICEESWSQPLPHLDKHCIPLRRNTEQVATLQSHHYNCKCKPFLGLSSFFKKRKKNHASVLRQCHLLSSGRGTPTSSKHFSQKSSPWFTVCSDLSLYMFYSCKISHYGWKLNKDCDKSNWDPLDCYQARQSLADKLMQVPCKGDQIIVLSVDWSDEPEWGKALRVKCLA